MTCKSLLKAKFDECLGVLGPKWHFILAYMLSMLQSSPQVVRENRNVTRDSYYSFKNVSKFQSYSLAFHSYCVNHESQQTVRGEDDYTTQRQCC